MSTQQSSHGLHASNVVTAHTHGRQQRALLIEDDSDSARWVQHVFRKHDQYQLAWVSGMSAALSRLHDVGIDVILLDLGLPDCSEQLVYHLVRCYSGCADSDIHSKHPGGS